MTTSLAESIPGHTPVEWADTYLTRLGFPLTPSNVQVIFSWEYAESGGGGGMWNPLNTTQPWPGATNANSVGVKNYLSWEDGLAASVDVIQNGYYGPILAALAQGHDAQAVVNAIIASPWGTKHLSLLPVPGNQPTSGTPPEDLHALIVADFKHAGTPPGRTRFVRLTIRDKGQPFTLHCFNGAKIAGHGTADVTQASNGQVLGIEPSPDGVHFVVTADDGGTFGYAFQA